MNYIYVKPFLIKAHNFQVSKQYRTEVELAFSPLVTLQLASTILFWALDINILLFSLSVSFFFFLIIHTHAHICIYKLNTHTRIIYYIYPIYTYACICIDMYIHMYMQIVHNLLDYVMIFEYNQIYGINSEHWKDLLPTGWSCIPL